VEWSDSLADASKGASLPPPHFSHRSRITMLNTGETPIKLPLRGTLWTIPKMGRWLNDAIQIEMILSCPEWLLSSGKSNYVWFTNYSETRLTRPRITRKLA